MPVTAIELNAQYTAGKAGGVWAPARLATAAALPANTYDAALKTLTANANGALVVDGKAAAVNDRVLVKNEAAPKNNGPYVVTEPGGGAAKYLLTRAADADESQDFVDGKLIAIGEGTANKETTWQADVSDSFVLDTDDVAFSKPAIAVNAAPTGITGTDAATTGVPATDAGTAAVTDSGHTHALNASGLVFHETFINPEAAGTSLGTIDETAASANPTAQPGHPRTLRVSFPAGYEGGTITVSGKKPTGEAQSETFAVNLGGDTDGLKTFSEITDPGGIVNNAPAGGGGDVATVKVGPRLGLSNAAIALVTKLSVDGLKDTIAASDITEGTVLTTTAPDGAKDFEVWYLHRHDHDGVTGSAAANVGDAGHSHTITDPGHQHPITDPTHTHTVT